MLEWKKQILRQKRFSQDQEIKENILNREAQLYLFMEHSQTHFYRLFSFLMKLRNARPDSTNLMDFSIVQPPDIRLPDKLSEKQSNKLLHSLSRRLKMVTINFEIEQSLKTDLQSIFQEVKSSQLPLIECFNLCCRRIIRQINIFKKQKKEEKCNFRIMSRNNEMRQKLNNKKMGEILCVTIYNILDVECIECSNLLAQNKELNQNVSQIYGLIKSRNKKIKKQINEYRDGYNGRSEKRKQIATRSFYNKSYVEVQRKQVPVVIRNFSNSSRKGKNVKFRSESKSPVKNQRQAEKSKFKLQPLVQKSKLKLIR